jgi:hypothetical protein
MIPKYRTDRYGATRHGHGPRTAGVRPQSAAAALRDRIAHLGDNMEDALNGVAHLLHLISAIDPRTRKDREALAFAAIEIESDGSCFEAPLRGAPQHDELASISRHVTLRCERSEPRPAYAEASAGKSYSPGPP